MKIKFSPAHPESVNATFLSTVLVKKLLLPLKVLADTVEVATQLLATVRKTRHTGSLWSAAAAKEEVNSYLL